MSHSNYSSLKKAIIRKAKMGMKEEVHDHISTEMQNQIYKKVYFAYQPKKYQRRKFSNGGLADEEVIKGTWINDNGNGFTYQVRNESRASRQPQFYLTPLIVMGQIEAMQSNYGLLYYKNAENFGYGKPRDFIKPTREYVRRNSKYLTKQLEHYMNKK